MRRNARFAWSLASALVLGAVARAEVTLRFVVWDGDDGLKVIRQAALEFEQANPGIKVKLEKRSLWSIFDKTSSPSRGGRIT